MRGPRIGLIECRRVVRNKFKNVYFDMLFQKVPQLVSFPILGSRTKNIER